MAVIEELLEEFKAQQQTIDTWTSKLEKTNARIAELEEQLHKDSHNSKPPSSDGYEKPSPKSQRKKAGEKQVVRPDIKDTICRWTLLIISSQCICSAA